MVTGAAVKEAMAGNGGGFGQLDRPLGDPVGEGRGMNAGNWTDHLGDRGGGAVGQTSWWAREGMAGDGGEFVQLDRPLGGCPSG